MKYDKKLYIFFFLILLLAVSTLALKGQSKNYKMDSTFEASFSAVANSTTYNVVQGIYKTGGNIIKSDKYFIKAGKYNKWNLKLKDIETLNLIPNLVYTNNNINCSVSAAYFKKSPLTYNFTWYNETVILQSDKNTCASGEQCSSKLDSINTKKEWNYTCQITVSVPGATKSKNVTKYITNSKPVMGSVSITPNNPAPTDDLTCVGIATDLDIEDTLSYDCYWFNSSVRIDGIGTGCVLDATNTSAAENWTCSKTSTDTILTTFNQTSQEPQISASNLAPELNSTFALTPSGRIVNNTLRVNNNTLLNFTLNYTEHDGDAVTLFVCNSSEADKNGCSDETICRSDSNITSNPIYCEMESLNYSDNSNTYYMRLLDSDGRISSAISGDYVVNYPPNTPSITSPAEGVAYAYGTTKVTLNWISSTDVNNDDIYYLLYSYRNEDLETLEIANTTTDTYYEYPISEVDDYYWSVQSFDSDGYSMNATPYISFKIAPEGGIGSGSVGGGGAGYTPPPQQLINVTGEVQSAIAEASICGNNVCQDGENPINCPQDCPLNVDELFCWVGDGQCAAWVFNVMIMIIVGSIFIVTIAKQKGYLK